MSQPWNVLVVGMPRSGTSLVAGIFDDQGYFTGGEEAELRPGDAHNPGGYWEAESLVEANARLFAEIGFDGHNSWLFGRMPDDAARRIAELPRSPETVELVERFQRHRPWMWKDPRLCYTLGYWWPLVDDGRTAVLFVRRDPEAIYQSFLRLGWREPGPAGRRDVEERIDEHLAATSWALREFAIPHVEVQYEEIAEDRAGVTGRIADLLDLDPAAVEIPFRPSFDHSSARGRLATRLDGLVTALPPSVRTALKRLVPRPALRLLYPERFRD